MAVFSKLHPVPTFLGSYTAILIGLAIKSRRKRAAILVPVIGAIYLSLKQRPQGISAGFNFALLSNAIDLLLITDVQRQFVKLPVSSTKISDAPFIKRLEWAINLALSNRGIGWKHSDWSHGDPSIFQGTESRQAFILTRLRSLVISLIRLYAVSRIAERDPWFREDAPPFSQQPFLRRCWSTVLVMGQFVPFLSIMHLIPALIAVSLRLSEPRSWPWILGSFGEAYTIRRLWRYSWHQILRQMGTSLSGFVMKYIILVKPGTKLASYIRILLTFFFTGTVHLYSTSSISPIPFFLMQGLAVIAEDIAIPRLQNTIFARCLSDANWQRLGYLWVWGFWAWSCPTVFDWWVKAGWSGISLKMFRAIFASISRTIKRLRSKMSSED